MGVRRRDNKPLRGGWKRPWINGGKLPGGCSISPNWQKQGGRGSDPELTDEFQGEVPSTRGATTRGNETTLD